MKLATVKYRVSAAFHPSTQVENMTVPKSVYEEMAMMLIQMAILDDLKSEYPRDEKLPCDLSLFIMARFIFSFVDPCKQLTCLNIGEDDTFRCRLFFGLV